MDTVTTEHFGQHLLDTRQLAEMLGVSRRTLEDWRLRGCGPRFVRASARMVRYRPSAVALWVAEREVSSTSDPGHAT
ncbi:MAG TPA: helix-turn-helix domain-containing protein [Acidobacteriota bacterium]|nr:helix-turn-helix domain-containing protein [Acidobacteriota bacterium]